MANASATCQLFLFKPPFGTSKRYLHNSLNTGKNNFPFSFSFQTLSTDHFSCVPCNTYDHCMCNEIVMCTGPGGYFNACALKTDKKNGRHNSQSKFSHYSVPRGINHLVATISRHRIKKRQEKSTRRSYTLNIAQLSCGNDTDIML